MDGELAMDGENSMGYLGRYRFSLSMELRGDHAHGMRWQLGG